MVVVGAVLIVLGISWLVDFHVWPFLIIAIGVAYLASAVYRPARSSVWSLPACCYPQLWFERETESEQQPEKRTIDG